MTGEQVGWKATAYAGIGAIGWAQLFALDGDTTIGRDESRGGRLLDVRDYCKLHIVFHWLALLTRGLPDPPRLLPISVVGEDSAGRRLLRKMRAAGLDTAHVGTTAARPTTYGVAFQYPDGAAFYVTSSNGAAAVVSDAHIRTAATDLASTRTVVAVALPEVALDVRRSFLVAFGEPGRFRVGSYATEEIGRAMRDGHLELLDLLAMNEDEAGAVLGAPIGGGRLTGVLDDLADRLTAINPRLQVVVTAGPRGAYAFDGKRWDHCLAPSVPLASTAGAGDALLAGVLAGRAVGRPLSDPDRSGAPLADRGLATALDVGILTAAFKLGFGDTIPPRTSASAMAAFGRRLGLSLPRRADWLAARN